jgi:hypothetical protein
VWASLYDRRHSHPPECAKSWKQAHQLHVLYRTTPIPAHTEAAAIASGSPSTAEVTCLCHSPRHRIIGMSDGSLHVVPLDSSAPAQLISLPGAGSIRHLQVTGHSSERVFAGSWCGQVFEVALRTGRVRKLVSGLAGPVYALRVHDPLLYCASGDGRLTVYDVRTGERVHSWKAHHGAVTDACIMRVPHGERSPQSPRLRSPGRHVLSSRPVRAAAAGRPLLPRSPTAAGRTLLSRGPLVAARTPDLAASAALDRLGLLAAGSSASSSDGDSDSGEPVLRLHARVGGSGVPTGPRRVTVRTLAPPAIETELAAAMGAAESALHTSTASAAAGDRPHLPSGRADMRAVSGSDHASSTERSPASAGGGNAGTAPTPHSYCVQPQLQLRATPSAHAMHGLRRCRLVTTSYDGSVRLWHMPSHQLLWCLPAHRGPVWSVACGRDTLYTAAADGRIKAWRRHGAGGAATLPKHVGGCTASAQGLAVAAGPAPSPATGLVGSGWGAAAFSAAAPVETGPAPSGRDSAGGDGAPAAVRDSETPPIGSPGDWECLWAVSTSAGSVYRQVLCLTLSGDCLFAGTSDGVVMHLQAGTGELVWRMQPELVSPVPSLRAGAPAAPTSPPEAVPAGASAAIVGLASSGGAPPADVSMAVTSASAARSASELAVAAPLASFRPHREGIRRLDVLGNKLCACTLHGAITCFEFRHPLLPELSKGSLGAGASSACASCGC